MLHNVSMLIKYNDYNIALITELQINIRDILNICGAFSMYKSSLSERCICPFLNTEAYLRKHQVTIG